MDVARLIQLEVEKKARKILDVAEVEDLSIRIVKDGSGSIVFIFDIWCSRQREVSRIIHYYTTT